MVHRCVVPKCQESSISKKKNLTFHVFPVDQFRKNQWIQVIQRENFVPSKFSRICSKHFTTSCFVGNRLRKDAIPTIFDFPDVKSIQEQLRNKITLSEESIQNICAQRSPQTAEPSVSGLQHMCSDKEHSPGMKQVHSSESTSSSPLVSAKHLMKRFKGNIPESDSPKSSITNISGITLLSQEKNNPVLRKQCSSTRTSSTATASEAVYEMKKLDKKRSNRYMNPKFLGDCLSDDLATPRKRKRNWNIAKKQISIQKKKIKYLHQRRRRLETRITNLAILMKELREKHNLSENAESLVLASLSDSAKELFEKMLRGPKKEMYTPELRSFAITLHFYSAKAYNFVREKFNKSLPHPATIAKWFQSINGEPGFTKEALEALKIKVAEAETKNSKVFCNLVMDEMYIRTQEIWTNKGYKGRVNIGTSFSDDVDLATQALVFMVVAVNANWKIPVGYFLINSMAADEKANIVNKCLEFLGQCNIKILSVTFDGCPTNLTMMKKLGASTTVSSSGNLNTKFQHPLSDEPVYFLLDACHMLKLLRNCLASVQQIHHDDGGIIQWEFFKKLSDIQEKEGLHAATKLRKRHIKWHEEKMRVKTAAQTFSKSVADALTYLNIDLQLEDFAGCEETVKFCILVNDLFDIFNSRNYLCKYKYKRPLDSKSYEYMFKKFDEVKMYFSKLKIFGRPVLQSQRKTGFIGFLINIASITEIFKNLILCENPELDFLLLYKFSQDHLEIFFCAIRSRGGFNNNPNAVQFESAYKRLLVHTEIKGSSNANCIAMDCTSILHISSRSINISQTGEDLTESSEFKEIVNVTDHDYTPSEAWHLTIYQNDVVSYIAGFVVKRLKKSVSCLECNKILETEESLSALQKRKIYGRLTNASYFVITVCQTGEKCFRFSEKTATFKRNNILQFLITQTLSVLPTSIFDSFSLQHILEDEIMNNHSILLTKQILHHYFNIRLHHNVASANLKREKDKIRKRLTKTIHFKNQ